MLIDAHWLARPAPVVGPDLIGCTLVRRMPDGTLIRGLIVETEAYTQDDPACHGYRGETPARRTLFGPPGHAYVYFTYGMYHCCNIVTDRSGYASAVLLRALLLDRLPDACTPPAHRQTHRVASGPGKLCRVLGIDRSLDGIPLAPAAGLWLEHRTMPDLPMQQTTRIGISRGVDLPWRWCLAGHPAVSKPVRVLMAH
jgi:DNA-3-methyladenine glycosylase